MTLCFCRRYNKQCKYFCSTGVRLMDQWSVYSFRLRLVDVFLEKTSALGERATVDVSWHLCGSYEKFPEPEHRSRSAAAPRVSQRFSLSLWTSAESPQNPVVYLWDGQLEFCVWDRRRSQTSWTSTSRQQNSECVCVFYMGSLKKKKLNMSIWRHLHGSPVLKENSQQLSK